MIRISKDAITFHYIESNGEEENPATVDVLSTSLGVVSYLSFPVEMEEGVTVGDLIRMLAKNIEATDYVFDSSLGGHSFREFVEETTQDVPDSINIQRMEISHQVDEVRESVLFETPRLRGVGFDGKVFSVEFSPIGTYMRLPLSLNESFVIKFEDDERTVELKKAFTLQEVIGSILYEMSYYGTPDMRQKALEDILEQSKELDETDEDTEGMEILDYGGKDDLDDIGRMQRDLERFLESEEYEAAARLRDRIRQVKDKGTNGDGLDITKK